MDYKILIPSYNRAEQQTTLELLSSDVFQPTDIIIATQCKKDYQQYNERYGKMATIIYREGNCVGENRNTLLEYCQLHNVKRGIMLDDDIRVIRCHNALRLSKPDEIKRLFDSCFTFSEKYNAVLFGGYITDNRLQMKKSVSKNKLLIGTIMGICDTSLRFNKNYRVKEDFELCLRLMSQGKTILRFNYFAAQARHRSRGGCENDWNLGYYKEFGRMLAMQYPTMVKCKKNGEITLINNK